MTPKEFEKRLKENLSIDREMINSLDDTFEYDSASTTDWVINRLVVIKKYLENGQTISIESIPQIKLNGIDDLKNWVSQKYYSILKDIFPSE